MAEPTHHQDDFTIDQLAHAAQLPTSTIRMYQQRGLIDPPTKRGRVGFYNSSHTERLRLIARLQQRGFSLAAVKELIDSWNLGQSIDELLGVSQIAPSLAPEPLRLSPSELAVRFAEVELTQADIQRAAAIGLIKLDDGDVVIVNPTFADIGPEVARLGIEIGEMLDEYEALRVAVDDISERFRAVFERSLWATFINDGKRLDDVPRLVDAATRLSQLATASVNAELTSRFAEFVQDYTRQAEAAAPDAAESQS